MDIHAYALFHLNKKTLQKHSNSPGKVGKNKMALLMKMTQVSRYTQFVLVNKLNNARYGNA